jgi:calcineurin-like phosphoesterase family protein
MNQTIIKNWNSVITNDDEIYCLGDFGWNFSINKLQEIMTQLNGKKHLISGNHDKQKMHIKSQLWDSVGYYNHININNIRVILCHYPIFDFDCAYHKSIHLFGHIHQQSVLDEIYEFHKEKGFYSYCVGVDFNNYTPIKFEDILEKIKYKA